MRKRKTLWSRNWSVLPSDKKTVTPGKFDPRVTCNQSTLITNAITKAVYIQCTTTETWTEFLWLVQSCKTEFMYTYMCTLLLNKLVDKCQQKCFNTHYNILHTPITLIPLIVWCLGCPCGTQPATTKCLSSSCALLIAFLKLSSDGFFTVQLLRSHRSAASESSMRKQRQKKDKTITYTYM